MSMHPDRIELFKYVSNKKIYLDRLHKNGEIRISEMATRSVGSDVRNAKLIFYIYKPNLNILEIVCDTMLIKAFEYDGNKYVCEISASILISKDNLPDKLNIETGLKDKINRVNSEIQQSGLQNWRNEFFKFVWSLECI